MWDASDCECGSVFGVSSVFKFQCDCVVVRAQFETQLFAFNLESDRVGCFDSVMRLMTFWL